MFLRLGLLVTLCALLQVAVFADARMVNIDGHTMVRLRAFCHQFGALSDYDANSNTYSVSRNGTTVYLVPYSTTAWINDNQVELKHIPVIIDDTMYVPLRFMCRAFNLDCTWGPGFAQVVIVDGFTHLQINWVRDDGWGARQHIWLHPDNFRVFLRVQAPPRQYFHGNPLPRGGGHKQNIGGHLQPVGHMPQIGRGQPPINRQQPQGAAQRPSNARNGNNANGHANNAQHGGANNAQNDNKGDEHHGH